MNTLPGDPNLPPGVSDRMIDEAGDGEYLSPWEIRDRRETEKADQEED